MTPKTTATVKRPLHRRVLRVLRYAAWTALVLVLAVGVLVWTGLADRWARHAIVGRLEKMTGGRVELRTFRFHPLSLRAELAGLIIHGREPENTPPFFYANSLFVDIRVDSLFRRKISLNEVRLERPAVHVRFEADGSNNVPIPRTAGKQQPLRERIFDLLVRKLSIRQGEVLFNDVRVPLVAEGGEFRFALDYHAGGAGVAAPAAFYSGEVTWQQMVVAARRYLPFPSDLSAKFTLERNAFTLNQLRWTLPHSFVDAQAALASFAAPAWSFRYRCRLNLADVREILRKPNTPAGAVEFSGEGAYREKQLTLRGRYAASDVSMPYQWFHSAGMSSRGNYQADSHQLIVPDFEARALGGVAQGKVTFVYRGQQFRADTHARGMSLVALLAAVDNGVFPVKTLHWNAGVDVDSVTTWVADFKHLESRGQALWSPPVEPREGKIAATARLDYRYGMDQRAVEIGASEISTPSSHLEIRGMLGALDSALEVRLDARDLEPWNDFIQRLRGATAPPQHVAGSATWQGRVIGPLGGPTFSGHFKAHQARYGRLYWDEVEGDLSYAPEEFRLLRTRARRGRSSALLDVSLELEDWGFRPENAWSLEANLERAASDDLQELFGWTYPVRGLLSGSFHGRGTRAEPELTGLFDLMEVEAWGVRLERARGQLSVHRDAIRISNAELRISPAVHAGNGGAGQAPRGIGSRPAGPGGVLTGNFLYRMSDREIAFDLTGAVIPLESIAAIQTPRLPLGGQLSFQLHGQGPLLAPLAQGTLRLVDLRVGKEVLGSFEGKLDSDGQKARLELNSAMSAGSVHGRIEMALRGEFPIEGEITVERMDLDPLIQTAFHLTALTGHSSVDGHFSVRGALARPRTLEVQADLSRLVFNYESVKLENVGPIRFHYVRDEVRIAQASLRGADTDFRILGFAQFAGDRRVGLSLAGTVNLRLLSEFLPGLEARGPAEVNAAIEGTLESPRITGKVHVSDASARFGEFPAGLSRLTGDFVFDSSRLLFENVTAETGGGQLTLGGSLTYGDGPLRYDVSARTARVRLRYPEGMSWLAGGTLRFSGTTEAGLLSGRVMVERLLMAEGFDLAALIMASKEPVRAPTTTSSFLRNLQFDIEGVTSPDARMEWTGARVETEASLRIRGTWEHPILLGHIHLLGGEMSFRGNRYRLSRGDINFANPFRLDPVLNVEAITTIRQYEVTLNFSGPTSRLTLAYHSDPPLPSSDIIALLALGRTGEESQLRGPTAVQSPELGATTLLSEAISSQLGGRLERLFGIRRFRVDPLLAGAGAEQNAAARITVEQQVTRDLVITYITNVTSTQQQVIQVEYNVNRNVSVVALRDQNGTFGLDVKSKKRFK